jgi:prevent-host-death family protein
MAMNPTRDIQSLTKFKRDTNRFVKQMKETKEPIFLTVNGTAEIVVQDAKSYQELITIKDRMEAIEGIKRGLAEMEKGEGMDAEEFFAKFMKENNILEEDEI